MFENDPCQESTKGVKQPHSSPHNTQRKRLPVPSPCWKHLIGLSHLKIYWDNIINGHWTPLVTWNWDTCLQRSSAGAVNKDPFKWWRGTSRHLFWILWKLLRKFVYISSVHAIESRHLCTSVQWGHCWHCYSITPIWWYWNGSLRQIVLNACIKQTTTAQTRTDCWAADEYNYKRLLRFIFYIVVIYRFRVYLIYIIYTQIFHEM